MRIGITRGQVSLTIDAPSGAAPDDTRAEASRALLDRLQHQLRRRGVQVTRQLHCRIVAMPRPGEVPRLAEACRVWLERQGCEVEVGDW